MQVIHCYFCSFQRTGNRLKKKKKRTKKRRLVTFCWSSVHKTSMAAEKKSSYIFWVGLTTCIKALKTRCCDIKVLRFYKEQDANKVVYLRGRRRRAVLSRAVLQSPRNRLECCSGRPRGCCASGGPGGRNGDRGARGWVSIIFNDLGYWGRHGKWGARRTILLNEQKRKA